LVLLLIIGLTLLGLAIVLVLRAFNVVRLRSTAIIGQINAYGFERRRRRLLPEVHGSLRSSIDDFAGTLGDTVATRFSGLSEENLRRELVAAGLYSLTPRRFLGYRVLSTLGAPALWLWTATITGQAAPMIVLGVLGGFVIGWIVPIVLVRNRARKRLDRIDYQLPELIDLLVVTIEAGVGFTGSLRLAADRVGGTLGEELRLMMQEQAMGLTVNEALSNMLDRADAPGMRSFVRSVLQGETLGVSIGQILRNLAVEMRKRRRAMAEEKAQKAPVKLLFPLVFLIFPAMFVVLLGPAVYAFLDAFKK
jgi:tight adherence protein C